MALTSLHIVSKIKVNPQIKSKLRAYTEPSYLVPTICPAIIRVVGVEFPKSPRRREKEG